MPLYCITKPDIEVDYPRPMESVFLIYADNKDQAYIHACTMLPSNDLEPDDITLLSNLQDCPLLIVGYTREYWSTTLPVCIGEIG